MNFFLITHVLSTYIGQLWMLFLVPAHYSVGPLFRKCFHCSCMWSG